MMIDLFREMRPVHWIKNLLVLAPLFFSGHFFDPRYVAVSLAAFAGFCMASGVIYIVNDLSDVEQDRQDPAKKLRPYAAGRLTSRQMETAAIALGGGAAVCAFFVGRSYSFVVGSYVAVMFVYNWFFKRYRWVGIFIICGGMILRILAGAVAIRVVVSGWVYPSTFLLAVYVVAGKRLYGDEGGKGTVTPVERFIFHALGAVTFAVYLVYCFSGIGPVKYHTGALWATAPFVCVAIWRYGVLMPKRGAGGEHVRTILSDPVIVVSVLIWTFMFGVLIYLRMFLR